MEDVQPTRPRIALILAMVVLAAAATACDADWIAGPGTDSLGPRDCECELFKEWVGSLPITPSGDRIEADTALATERVNGFSVLGGMDEPTGFDRNTLATALTNAGFNSRVDRDRPDSWNAIFYPGASQAQSRWTIDITQTEGQVVIRVGVTVDGTPWGLETIDDLWDSYRTDREAAKQALIERQERAIDTLRVLEAALQGMVTNEQ